MGSWAPGPFDNDEAADFIEDLTEAPDWRTVTALLEHVSGLTGYIEEPEGQMAVAAAAIVASCVGAPSVLPDTHAELKAALGAPPEGATYLARKALARVVGTASELDELWQEGEDHDAWLTQIAGLQSLLNGQS
jgi:predicted benzoate:H+ symporter BenE